MSTLLCFYSEIHFVTKDYRYTHLLCKDTKLRGVVKFILTFPKPSISSSAESKD